MRLHIFAVSCDPAITLIADVALPLPARGFDSNRQGSVGDYFRTIVDDRFFDVTAISHMFSHYLLQYICIFNLLDYAYKEIIIP